MKYNDMYWCDEIDNRVDTDYYIHIESDHILRGKCHISRPMKPSKWVSKTPKKEKVTKIYFPTTYATWIIVKGDVLNAMKNHDKIECRTLRNERVFINVQTISEAYVYDLFSFEIDSMNTNCLLGIHRYCILAQEGTEIILVDD